MAEAARYGVALEDAGAGSAIDWHGERFALTASYDALLAARPGVARIFQRLEDLAAGNDTSAAEHTLAAFLAGSGESPDDAALAAMALFPLTGAHPSALGLGMVLNEIRFHGGTIGETISPKDIRRLVGGTGEIAKRMAAGLPQGVLRLETRVDGVADYGDCVVVSGPFGQLTVQSAIVALPLNVLHRLAFLPDWPEPVTALLHHGHAGRTMKFWVHATWPDGQALPDERFLEGHPFRLVYAKSAADGACLICAQALVDEAAQHDDAAIAAIFEQLLPGCAVKAVARHDWVADPLALGSWHSERPGQRAALRHLTQPRGRVRLCGGDFNDPWSGWIEGAILSGAAAAKAIVAA
jgi:monoamine oxidase